MTHPRTAFTLVELLVVIAIISIMCILLLPAINAARESARRAKCVSNVTQQIFAVHEYEMAFGVLPKGTINKTSPIINREQGFHQNWIVQILPYVDERVLFDGIDLSKSVYDPANKKPRARAVDIFTCPSSSFSGHITDYAGVHHDIESPIAETNNGVFILNLALARDDIADGFRHTLFLGEKVSDAAGEFGWMSGTRSTLRNTGSGINQQLGGVSAAFYQVEFRAESDADDAKATSDNANANVKASSVSDTVASESARESVADGVLAVDPGSAAPANMIAGSTYEEVLKSLDANTASSIASGLYVGGFGSSHTGGAVFAFGDGSVRLLPDSIDRTTFQQLGNRHDGQLINNDEL